MHGNRGDAWSPCDRTKMSVDHEQDPLNKPGGLPFAMLLPDTTDPLLEKLGPSPDYYEGRDKSRSR